MFYIRVQAHEKTPSLRSYELEEVSVVDRQRGYLIADELAQNLDDQTATYEVRIPLGDEGKIFVVRQSTWGQVLYVVYSNKDLAEACAQALCLHYRPW